MIRIACRLMLAPRFTFAIREKIAGPRIELDNGGRDTTGSIFSHRIEKCNLFLF
jgi:hypothetical protein